MTDIVARQHRLRRMAKRRGYILVKMRGEGSRLLGEAKYILVAPHGGLSLDDVEAILTREAKRQWH